MALLLMDLKPVLTTLIDQWVKLVNEGNNGGYANIWLLCNINTGEIARFEQGLKHQELLESTDGFYYGCNACHIVTLSVLTTAIMIFVNKLVHVEHALKNYYQGYLGQLMMALLRAILTDKYDPYLGYQCASSRNICAHYDVDPQYYADDPHSVWNVPFFPGGSCDGKCANATDIENLNMWGIFGRADGEPFDAKDFMKQHPEWNWQKGYLYDRPSQPWTLFD
ncbi:hypothetical protein [Lactobacillus johnsonii]|uniref:hypothetical protein n=1 Tax=Lactobacillus johnsonii TaxID=33959 RepID=UPI0022E2ED0D|nr:hypothetical protein [Lactobacillus johnsonii]